jgi:DNA-directed RNA polymerase specialized sigma24 family protein
MRDVRDGRRGAHTPLGEGGLFLRASAFEVPVTPAERIERAIAALSDADLLRLKQIAQFRARRLPGIEWADLFNEAVGRALAGDRHWPIEVPLVAFLAGIMRSLAEELWRQQRQRNAFFAAAWASAGGSAAVPSEAPDPERELYARQSLAAIEALFAPDADALRLVAGLAEGLSAAEIQLKTGMDATRYATTRRRIRRTLLRIQAERDRIW